VANRGVAWIRSNGDERHVTLVGEGIPVPQQDNCLARRGE
jgi:hypothetical protein